MALSKLNNDSFDDTAVHGRRNLVINGAMQVFQRATAATTATTTYSTADRFVIYEATDGSMTTEKSSDHPFSGSSLKAQVTGADTSIAAGQFAYIYQNIEAQNLQHLLYGTSSAKTLTLSFYVKSSKTGVYTVNLDKGDNTGYIFVAEYTISSANTWEKKTITIAPDSNIQASGGAIANDTGTGLSLGFGLVWGSNVNGGTGGTWSARSNNYYGTTNQVNWMDSTSNNFYLTEVQLEVGDKATPFEHRSFTEELALCQRYFFKSYPTNRYAGFNTANDVREGACITRNQDGSARSANAWPFHYPVTMRTQPTITSYSLNGTSGKASKLDGSLDHSSDVTNNGYYETAHQNGWQIVEASLDGLGFGGFHVYSDAEL